MQRSALCRSRRELSNEYLLAKSGVDTAENEPCKVCPLSAYRSPRSAVGGTRIQCSGPTAPMTAVMAPLVAAVTVGELRSKMEGLGISADVFLNVVLLLTGVLLAERNL